MTPKKSSGSLANLSRCFFSGFSSSTHRACWLLLRNQSPKKCVYGRGEERSSAHIPWEQCSILNLLPLQGCITAAAHTPVLGSIHCTRGSHELTALSIHEGSNSQQEDKGAQAPQNLKATSQNVSCLAPAGKPAQSLRSLQSAHFSMSATKIC